MKTSPLDINEITRRQWEWTVQWHDANTPPQEEPPWNQVERNHRMNFDLWHEEDMARRNDLGAERIREAKRLIDRCNQARNDAIEQMDIWLLGNLPPANTASPQHSETPGMIIDRLSILSLKRFHMRLEAERSTATQEHRNKCRAKWEILETQAKDLRDCVEQLIGELLSGRRHFKLYRQLKMYNDATLNPQLYGKKTE